jgi:hypothetical protein
MFSCPVMAEIAFEDRGFLARIEGGADIEGNWRRDAWHLKRSIFCRTWHRYRSY